ncbi:hypothetical protein NKJ16_15040 [Mesorhizobium sp. M0179]|nr:MULTISPECIES: hypothetical protein [unclassified Mesorhizobium]ESX08716.1 hypothetical protein X768_21770 [Mesorhizobium sp. LSJC265A00]ESY06720.1 hypothetical protein X753_07835 [Mesorhizobium sp. LNJC399B00]WJI68622.1 hypothetical protein NLY36_28225 [Mesorhizobium sp. C399B]
MADPKKETDEKRFNETVQRMLKTPPKPKHKETKTDDRRAPEGKKPKN